jgi:hypothetical protein
MHLGKQFKTEITNLSVKEQFHVTGVLLHRACPVRFADKDQQFLVGILRSAVNQMAGAIGGGL